MRKTAIWLAVAFTSLFGPSEYACAVSYTWEGSFNDDLTNPLNWLPTYAVTPTTGDIAIFDGSIAVSTIPFVNQPDSFDALKLLITGTPGPFTFTIDGQSAGIATMTLGAGGPSGGVYTDFTSPSAVTTFYVNEGGELFFYDGASADGTLSGNVQYNAAGYSEITQIYFNNYSGAGKAEINLEGSKCFLTLYSSDMQMATVTAVSESTIEFNLDATAGDSTIDTLNAYRINFFDQSTLGNATFNLIGTQLFFDSTTSSSTAAVNLTQGTVPAELYLNASLVLDELSSDSGSLITLNNRTLTVGDDVSTTIAGQITGTSGKFIKQGTGTIILSGVNNTYSGGTSILEGTLQVSAANLPAAKPITNVTGTLSFVQNTNGQFDGKIVAGTGLIKKTGFGELILTADSSGFSGLTSILQGQLTLNGILGGNISVDQTGILGGTGKALGNVTLYAGTISPGSGIGTFNIGGNYIQNAAATYLCEVDGAGNSDLINIDGTATLDGTLEVVIVDGVINPTKVYTILHAEGGVSGEFSSVTAPLYSLYVPQVIYLPNDVQLSVDSVFNVIAETYNQKQVAKQLATLNFQNATTEEAELLRELLFLASQPQTIDSARKALSQMSGEQYTNHMFTAELIGRGFIRRLYDPLREIILNRGACCNRDVYYNCYDCNGVMVIDGDPWISDPSQEMGPWIEVSGGHSFLRHNHNASGFQSNNYEVTMGIQTTFLDIWTLGVAGGYEFDKISHNIGGTTEINTGMFGLYTLIRPEGYYFLGDVVFDYSWGKLKRPIDVGVLNYQARSKPHFTETMVYLEGGKDVCFENLLLQPFLGFEIDYYAARKVTESNAVPVNLIVRKKNRTAAYSRLGLHFASTSLGCWNLALDVAWQYRMTNTRNHVREHFALFGDTFSIKGVSIPRNSLDVAGYVSALVCDGWELFTEVSAERWSRGCTYNFLGGVKFCW